MELLRNLKRRRLRVFLTVFGIAIGIFALVVLGGMAEKINLLIAGGIDAMTNRILITQRGSSLFGMSVIDASSLAEVAQVPGVGLVTATIDLPLQSPDETVTTSFGMPEMVEGLDVSADADREDLAQSPFKLGFVAGDWWKPGQTDRVVLGADLAQKFGKQTGDRITIRGFELTVSGVLERTLTGPDKIAFVSLEKAREMLKQAYPLLQNLDVTKLATSVMAIPQKGEDASEVAARIRQRFPQLRVVDPNEARKQIESAAIIMNLIIMGSALIAIIVGGLSVINTMVMAVSERVREIGTKKAIGATDGDVLREYLAEAGAIGLIGGLLGLGGGWLATAALNHASASTGSTIFLVTPRLAIGSVLFALVLGLVSGYLPARHAARLNPIDALRYE